jgi:hypothetical protein
MDSSLNLYWGTEREFTHYDDAGATVSLFLHATGGAEGVLIEVATRSVLGCVTTRSVGTIGAGLARGQDFQVKEKEKGHPLWQPFHIGVSKPELNQSQLKAPPV